MKETIEAMKRLDLPVHEKLALEYVEDILVDAEDIEDVIRGLEETNIAAGSGIASELMFTDKVYAWVHMHVREFDEAIQGRLLEDYGWQTLAEMVWFIIELGARDLAARLRGEL